MNIKNVIIIAVVAVMSSSCNQTKIGYMDVEKVMTEYQGTKDRTAVIKVFGGGKDVIFKSDFE